MSTHGRVTAPRDDSGRCLREFEQAMSREAHHLLRRPDLMEQQILNSLQWVEPGLPLVEHALARALNRPSRPWAHQANGPRQGRSLQFVVDAAQLNGCLVDASSTRIWGTRSEGPVLTWEARTGRPVDEVAEGEGSRGDLVGRTASGEQILLTGAAFSLRDPASGAVRGRLLPAALTVRACSETLAGLVLVEAQGDSIRVWTPTRSWTERFDGPVGACAIDGDTLVAVTQQGSVTVQDVCWWDAAGPYPYVRSTRLWGAAQQGRVVAASLDEASSRLLLLDDHGVAALYDVLSGEPGGQIRTRAPALSCAVRGDTVVLGATDGTVSVHDSQTGAEQAAWRQHSSVLSCALSDDGGLVLTGGSDGRLHLWEPSGVVRWRVRRDAGAIPACAFGGYTQHAAVAADEIGSLELWWVESGEQWYVDHGPHRIAGGTHPGGLSAQPRACGVSPTGAHVAAVTVDGLLHVWDTGTRARVDIPTTLGVPPAWDAPPGSSCATACAVTAAGDYVVLGAEDGSLRVVNTRSGKEMSRVQGHDGLVRCCASSPSGEMVVTGGADGWMRRWSVPDLVPAFEVRAHRGGVQCVAITPDGAAIVTGRSGPADDSPGAVWHAVDGRPRGLLEGQDALHVDSCAVSPDGRFAVTVGAKNLALWDLARLSLRREAPKAPGGAVCVFSADGGMVFSGQGVDLAAVDAATGDTRFRMDGVVDGELLACAVSPGGDFVATGGMHGRVTLWDATTGDRRTTLEPLSGTGGPVGAFTMDLSVSHCGRLVFSGAMGVDTTGPSTSVRPATRVWCVETGEEWLLDGRGSPAPEGLSFCRVEGEAEDAHVAFVDLGSGEVLRELPVTGTALPDWSQTVTFRDGFRTREASTGRELVSAPPPTAEIRSVRATPDGRLLVLACEDAALRVYRVQDLSLVLTIPTPAEILSMDVHAWRPQVACGDVSGGLNIYDLVGVEFGPVSVTALDDGRGPRVRCPRCLRTTPLGSTVRDAALECSTSGCGQQLRPDGFVARPFEGRIAERLLFGAFPSSRPPSRRPWYRPRRGRA